MTKENIGYSVRRFGFCVMDDFGNLVKVPNHDFHAVLVCLRITRYREVQS